MPNKRHLRARRSSLSITQDGMRALSFKDDRIFQHLRRGACLRINRAALQVAVEGERGRKRKREGQKIGPHVWLAFETRYFHFQRAAIQGPRASSYSPSACLASASFFVFSRDVSPCHLMAQKATRSRPEHLSHVCAICRSASRTA